MKRPDATHPATPVALPVHSSQKSLHVGVDWLNTTWRIAVPVLGATVLGIFLDKKLGTAPWLTLLLVVVGFVAAGWLVAKLLKEAEGSE